MGVGDLISVVAPTVPSEVPTVVNAPALGEVGTLAASWFEVHSDEHPVEREVTASAAGVRCRLTFVGKDATVHGRRGATYALVAGEGLTPFGYRTPAQAPTPALWNRQ